ncbi:MAG: enolase C-terminal domain-like protein [Solirubrobacteraceae bacterium]
MSTAAREDAQIEGRSAGAERRIDASEAAVDRVEVLAYEIPTDGPDGRESDGTLDWDSTTLVVVLVASAGGELGLGYTYASKACAVLIEEKLAPALLGKSPMAVNERWEEMGRLLRNAGRPGVGMMALSAVDVALWDLKARLCGLALVDLLDRARDSVPVYGSGGFCNYPSKRLQDQLRGWVEQGIPRVKLKVSRRPYEDFRRMDAARKAVGSDTELFVDSNGALSRKQALEWAQRFKERWDVRWFEEPVSSADLEGLRLLRERGPGGLDIAAGEYVFVLRDALNLLEAHAVDCLQLDVTRCGGISGIVRCAGAADAHELDVSGHCAPQVSAHALCAVPRLRHLEYFHDHVRIERMAFDGVLEPSEGSLQPERSQPGMGLELKRSDMQEHCVYRTEARR